ncbi:MAG: hypothetical protein MN733_26660, partial [Nitrososphaera sp.]|nr:hypothetical protein [Nitrososphaera sp.]
MPEDLTPKFLRPLVDHLELLSLFEIHFGGARSTPEDDVVYPNSDSYALKVRCKGTTITHIESGPALSNTDLDKLLEKVQSDLIEIPSISVGADILFCSRPVHGSFRSPAGHIQILPAPENAPRPSVLIADHPFVLEFTFRQSRNWQITYRRRIRARTEWTWIVNLMLREMIKYIGPHGVRRLWVLPTPPEELAEKAPVQARVRWAQEFYMIDGFSGYRDDFSPQTSPELQKTQDEKYY